MKRLIAFILCAFLLCTIIFAMNEVSVHATEDTTAEYTDTNPTTETETNQTTEMTVGVDDNENVDDVENVVDTEIRPPEEIPGEGTEETPADEDLTALLSKQFEEWVVPHLEEISVIITMIGTLFYQIRKNKALGKSIGTMNNNTVTIAEQSANMVTQALTGMENVSAIVTAYDARIATMLEAFRATAQDKERLEKELAELKCYFRTSAQANLEFSNELAELLNLANIPNFKKQEIGARHLAAVNAIKAACAEGVYADTEEVAEYAGEKA